MKRLKEVKRFIKRKGICQASDIMKEFSLSRSSVIKYLKEAGTLTSFNSRGKYYILPQYHKFNESGLIFIGEVGFCKSGNLLSTICHLVEISPRGLGARELDDMLKTTTHSQLPNLHRTGKLNRESAENRPGHAYIYFSRNDEKFKMQREAYFSVDDEPEEEPKEELTLDELPDVIDILLTLLSHPEFSAKSVALSLQRRGLKVSSAFNKRVFHEYDL